MKGKKRDVRYIKILITSIKSIIMKSDKHLSHLFMTFPQKWSRIIDDGENIFFPNVENT